MRNLVKGIIITVVVIIALGFITVIWMAFSIGQLREVDAHKAFCQHWLGNLNEAKVQLKDAWFPGDAQIAQLNSEIGSYNQQCGF